jgi:hypothetical protein
MQTNYDYFRAEILATQKKEFRWGLGIPSALPRISITVYVYISKGYFDLKM